MTRIHGNVGRNGTRVKINVLKTRQAHGVYISISGFPGVRLDEHYALKLANAIVDASESWEPRDDSSR